MSQVSVTNVFWLSVTKHDGNKVWEVVLAPSVEDFLKSSRGSQPGQKSPTNICADSQNNGSELPRSPSSHAQRMSALGNDITLEKFVTPG